MRDNKLYHFLHTYPTNIVKGVPLTFKAMTTSIKQKNYLLAPLPKSAETQPLNIFLIDDGRNKGERKEGTELELLFQQEHHFTTFPEIDPNNPNYSEGHYTAYFINKKIDERDSETSVAGTHYQLHVHLNFKFQLATTPQLSVLQDDNTYQLLPLTADSEDLLLSFAEKHYKDFVNSINANYQQQLKADKTKHIQMSLQLEELSRNKNTHPELYLKGIDENLAFLSSIIIYHEKNGFYIGAQKILRNIKNLMSSTVTMHANSNSTSTHETKTSSANDVDNTTRDDGFITALEFSLETTPTTNTKNKSPERTKSPKYGECDLPSLVKKAEAATHLFQKEYLASSPIHRAELLNEALQSALEAYIFVPDKELYKGDISDLNTLQNILLTLYQACEKLLPMLLLKGHYKEAKWFINQSRNDSNLFGDSEIDQQMVSLALMQGNHELLEFILKETDFPIHTFSITTPKDGQISAPLYCFLNDTASSSKTQCLNVLVKHGVSLMEPCPKTGIPLAHSIISAYPKHACMIVLEENRQSTLLNPRFFHKLICLLKPLNASPELIDYIHNYEHLIKKLTIYTKGNTGVDHKQESSLSTAYAAVVEEFTKLENFILLTIDSDIRKASFELAEIQKDYLARVTNRHQKRKLKKAQLDIVKMMLEPEGLDFFKTKSCETLKKAMMAHYRQSIATLKDEIIIMDMKLPVQHNGYVVGSKNDMKTVRNIVEKRQHSNRKEREEEEKKKKDAYKTHEAVGHLGESLGALKAALSGLSFFTNKKRETSDQVSDQISNPNSLNGDQDVRILAERLSGLDQTFGFVDTNDSMEPDSYLEEGVVGVQAQKNR